ncbi:MAG: hypothetical protein AABZ74_10060 [Cyanobacteriota bacterium]
MKYFKLFFFITLVSFLSSCACGFKYINTNVPMYAPKSDFIKKIKTIKPKEINNAGKIYLYKNFIFVHEKDAGVHIIDNTDIKNPKNIVFLRIPFSTDISIKDNILYADMFNDLISIDINDINNIKILKINENIFEKDNVSIDETVEIGYKTIKTEYIPVFCGEVPLSLQPKANNGLEFYEPSSPEITPRDYSNNYKNTEIGGSLARFSIIEDYLYVLSSSVEMIIYNLQNTPDLKEENTIKIGSELETIFPYDNKLFLGSKTRMYVYDNENKTKPKFLSSFQHIKSCDPVVVENKKAYVTLRGGGITCNSSNNELDIVNIEDIKNPKLIRAYPMKNPSGLAIKNNILYLCDGVEGLKIFDVSNSNDINLIKTIPINNPKDIILNENDHAIIISQEGLFQYDFSNLKKENLELSKILIKESNLKNDNVRVEQIKIKNPEILLQKNLDLKQGGKVFYYNWYEKYFLE